MKKVALSLAGVLAAAAFAPEASALPAFARQTGMACTACHFQKFPVLNGFGRAFKASGYTLMGAQGKVEGEHLSIPDTMNAAMLMKYRYQKTSGNGALATAGAGQTAATGTNDGQWQMGDELSLFFGGRVADSDLIKIGFLSENNLAAAAGMPVAAGIRIPIVIDAGAVKISAVPFTTDGLGVQYGYELSSGGVMRANRGQELRRNTSAVQYNADRGSDGGNAAGHAFVVQHDMFFVNYTIWSSTFAPGAGGGAFGNTTNYGQRYFRAAVTPSFAGWDIVAGIGRESGTSWGGIALAQIESNQKFIDVQAHGEIAGAEVALYAQNAKAPVCMKAAAANCAHNTSATNERSATTLGGEVTVIPHALTVGAFLRKADNGGAIGVENDNATTLTAVYDLFQNVALHVNYATYSGNAHGPVARGVKHEMLMMLEAAW